MPCYDERDSSDYIRKHEVGPLIQMLCEACKKLEATGWISGCSPELRKWFAEHKERDRKEGK